MKAHSIVLRHGTVDDANQSLSLFRGVVEEEQFFMISGAECARTLHAQEGHIRHHILDRDSCILMAFSQEKLVGQISIRAGSHLRVRHVGSIEMFVKREFRGCGIGTQLLQQSLEWCRQRTSLRKIDLSVFADNEGAVALYTKFGFVIEGRIKGAFREVDNRLRDNILMGLWIQ